MSHDITLIISEWHPVIVLQCLAAVQTNNNAKKKKKKKITAVINSGSFVTLEME